MCHPGAIETATFSVDEPSAVSGWTSTADVIETIEVGPGEAWARAQPITNASESIAAATATIMDAGARIQAPSKAKLLFNWFSGDVAERRGCHNGLGRARFPQKRLGVERRDTVG